MGCQFLGTGERALGRLACDGTSRRQASARLPEGIGGVGGVGGLGLIPFVPFLGLGDVTGGGGWLARLRPLVPIALAFAAGVLILKGMKKPRSRARARNAVKLRPGQRWQRGSGELWKACSSCAEAMGPFQLNLDGPDECMACRDSATTGTYTAAQRTRNRVR
jgi:hypothetical protein